MNNPYYKLPLNATQLAFGKDAVQCKLYDSIRQHIHLLTTTHFEECPFEPELGCVLWDIDFTNVSSDKKIVAAMQQSLIKTIQTFEKRLQLTDVLIQIRQEEKGQQQESRLKKRIHLQVKGVIKKTRENFVCNEQFFIGPLSY